MHLKRLGDDTKKIKVFFYKAFLEKMRQNQADYDLNSNFPR
jgi:hypothetical protein